MQEAGRRVLQESGMVSVWPRQSLGWVRQDLVLMVAWVGWAESPMSRNLE